MGSTIRLWRQFVAYWGRVLRWDLGESFINGQSVNSILYEKAPRSIRLAIWATIIEITVGISVGLIAAVRRYSLTDKATTLATTAAAAIPVFVLGFILQYVFAVLPERYGLPDWMQLRTSRLGPDTWFLFFIPVGEQWRYLILPAVTLACVSTALAARMMRGSMLDVLNADYIRTARSKGLSESTVVLRHGLRNALIPVVTLIGIDFGVVIGAAVLTETVFSWPGIGSQIVDSVNRRDLPVILGLSLGRGDHLLDRQPLGRLVVCLVRPAHPPRGTSRVMRYVLASLLAQQDGRVRTLPSSSCLVLTAVFADLIAPYSYREQTLRFRVGPSRDHWFGTDNVGRDLFSRVVYGARISLKVGVLATLMAVMIGTTFGAIAGFFGGGTDSRDDAHRRHLLVDPLHHPRRVDRHLVRAQCQFADHRPRAHRVAGHRPRRAGIVPQHQEDGVRRGGPGPRFRPHADDLRPPAAERFRAGHRLRHDRDRRRRSWPRRRCRSSGSGRRRQRRRGD